MNKKSKKKIVSQSMRWHITINNPLDYGLDRAKIKEILAKFNLAYWCMVDEIATTGTPHTHIVIVAKKSKIRFSTIRRRFQYVPHIEELEYSIDTNVNYMHKDLHDYSNFEEFGERPKDDKPKGRKEGANSQLLTAVRNGLTTDEILTILPSFTTQVRTIEHLTARHLRKTTLNKARKEPLICIVKTGATGTGKTRSTMDEANGSIYRITYYRSGRGVGPIFDNYEREEYLCFEEFMGSKSVPINEMLTYLDPWYPCPLGSRYTDPCSCYSHVIINTNLPFESLYKELTDSPETMEQYRAWLRRINEVWVYKRNGLVEKYDVNEYMNKVLTYDKDFAQRIVNYMNNTNKGE